MEFKFTRKPMQCLRPFFGQVHTQEQTQEIRLPDAYPDIGKILGCWGQVLIRGKEWRSTAMAANGGVMAWVMYAPEDGTQIRILDVWIPIQCRWDFSNAMEDGAMILCPVLKNLDARGVSARKIIVRCGVDTFAQAMSRDIVDLAVPDDLPQDLQLLKRSYPMDIPVEAGEKQVQMEETLSLAENLPLIHKIICYTMTPSVTEQKVLGNRLVFRGQITLTLVYMTEEGTIHQWEAHVPFSQYTELDKEHSSHATAWVMPLLTASELEADSGNQLQLRAGIAAQYIIIDRAIVEIVEDAYSTTRQVQPKSVELNLPSLLDCFTMELSAEALLQGEMEQVLIGTPYSGYPIIRMDETGQKIQMSGKFQTLTRNSEGQVHSDFAAYEAFVPFDAAEENRISLWMGAPSKTDAAPNGEGTALKSAFPVTGQIYNGQTIPMVTELEFGEVYPLDEQRPSIVLRRAGQEDLWSLAKRSRSTVEAIRQANQLTEEPEKGQMLLIPVS